MSSFTLRGLTISGKLSDDHTVFKSKLISCLMHTQNLVCLLLGEKIVMKQKEEEENCVRSFVTVPVLTKEDKWRAYNK
jgi:hypothetical protein